MPDNRQPYRRVPCPNCGTLIEWSPEQRWRPFCSERCRLIDLGSWLDERNRIPGTEAAPGDPSGTED
ncbi:MAG: DNA gyrase inhibitor YacG [Gammaproteobacteria bacterium]|nr:DNA gyrase inhibitor YacG [Gammaproteobacteria bacterium]